jgi:hypothetical protein
VCGNGVLEEGEECDQPGNSCCSFCRFTPPTVSCFEDGNRCTLHRCNAAHVCVQDTPAPDGELCNDFNNCNPPNPFGLTEITLAAGGDGAARMLVMRKGPALFAPNDVVFFPHPPPFPLRLRVQLGARDSACWEATFSGAGLRKNVVGKFRARSD